jgi:hypothetical protein
MAGGGQRMADDGELREEEEAVVEEPMPESLAGSLGS